MPCCYTVSEQMFLDDVVSLTNSNCSGPEGNLRSILGVEKDMAEGEEKEEEKGPINVRNVTMIEG